MNEILLIALGFSMYYCFHHEATKRKILTVLAECKATAKTEWVKHKAAKAQREAEEALNNG